MRKKFVYFVLIPFIILCVVVYLFIDRWVAAGLEAGGEAITGAKVEFEHLSVSLAPIGIQWQRLQVANARDPMKNIFETGKVRFALNFGQLLRGKFIIETMEVNDLILGTVRSTDGSLPKHEEPKKEAPAAAPAQFEPAAQTAIGKTAEAAPTFSLDRLRKGINVDSLVKALDPQTLKLIDSLQRQVTAGAKSWDSVNVEFASTKQKLADGETSLKAINPSALKGVDNIVAAINTVDNSAKTISGIGQTVNARRTAVEASIQKLSGSVGSIDDAAKGDLQHLMAMAKIPDLNTTGIAKLLVGKEMYERALTYLHWVDVAREHIRRHAPAPEEQQPAPFRGQDIHFPVVRSYPKLWIQKILVSGGTDSTTQAGFIHLNGQVLNVTSDQEATGVPMTCAFDGTEGGRRTMTLRALWDRTKEVPLDEYHATITGVPLSSFELGSTDFLPAHITSASLAGGIDVSAPGDNLDAHAKAQLSGMKLVFAAEPRNEVETLVKEVLASITGFGIDLRLWRTSGKFDVALATDLDDQIAARVKAVIGAEVTKMRDQLQAKLQEKVSAKRQELEKLFNDKKSAVEQQLAGVQSLVDQKTGMIDAKKKELTDRLAKENAGKAQDVLKNLFKK